MAFSLIRIWAASIVFVGLLFASIAGSYVITINAINSSNHRWCTTLTLLTSKSVPKPPDPKANPSRQNAYVFYTNLTNLERQFHC